MSARTLGIPLTARLNATVDVRVNLRYDPADPWAVTLDVSTTAHNPQSPAASLNWTTWQFSRDLLADGLNGRTGEGDVQVYPDDFDPAVWVELSSPTGHASLMFDKADLEKALERIEILVPPGTEDDYIDWAREWDLLAQGHADTRWPGLDDLW